MPLLYGEGGKAFLRLQWEIINSTHDPSNLAWYCAGPDDIYARWPWTAERFFDCSCTISITSNLWRYLTSDLPLLCLDSERLRSIERNGNSVEFLGIPSKQRSMESQHRSRFKMTIITKSFCYVSLGSNLEDFR
mgnify:CR=1 FL=1